jgi:hypothetical protein
MAAPAVDAVRWMARMGYAARGIVYLLVGGLAALAAFGQGGQTTGSRGALERLITAPLGDVILAALAVGLTGFSLWRCVQALRDTDHHGLGPKGLTVRVGLLVSAVTHLLLAVFAVSLIFAFGGGGSDGDSEKSIASWLMRQPFGRWLVAVVGMVMIGVGIAHAVKGAVAHFDRHFDMPATTQLWAYPICRFGLITRGLVFIIAGGFFLLAAHQLDPDEAGGMAEVFDSFRNQPYGTWLIASVAVGLFAFGLYSLLEAIYRRVEPDA